MAETKRVALFIDAENASPSHVEAFRERARELGKLTIARCYGSATALLAWEPAMTKHHLIPVQTPPSANKANASDFALTIDAVSLLHRDLFDHALIASSDADFTLLVVHIREHGKGIYGIGETKARPSLKSAFDKFTLIAATATSKPDTKTSAKLQPKTESKPQPQPQPAPKTTQQNAGSKNSKPLAPVSIDAAWLTKIFHETRKSAEFADLQAFGRALASARKDYKRGHRTLRNYLLKSNLFRLEGQSVYLQKAETN